MTMRDPLGITVVGAHHGGEAAAVIGALLAQSGDRPLAAVVPNLEALPIDPRRIRSRDPLRVVLDDGSLCVSSAPGLLPTLVSLLQATPRPVRVIVDAGDQASWEVAQFGRLPGFSIAGIVVVLPVDRAIAILTAPRTGRATRDHLARADSLLLSGISTVSPQDLARIRRQIRGLVPGPRIVLEAPGGASPDILAPPAPRPPAPRSLAAYAVIEQAGIASVSWASSCPIDRHALLQMLADHRDRIDHIAGIVALRDTPNCRTLVVRQAGAWTLVPGAPWHGATPATTLVVSGPGSLATGLTRRAFDGLLPRRERGHGPNRRQSRR